MIERRKTQERVIDISSKKVVRRTKREVGEGNSCFFSFRLKKRVDLEKSTHALGLTNQTF